MKKCFLFALLLMTTAALNAATTTEDFTCKGDSTFLIEINTRIQHGTILTDPMEFADADDRVTIIADPQTGYQLLWVSVTKNGDASQTVPVNNMSFQMPWFDVYIDAAFGVVGNGPTINGTITAPTICAGQPLTLTAPPVTNATRTEWQISADKNFTSYEVYTNQVLDRTYNGWNLRFMASNNAGTVYSNIVTIRVNNLGNLNLTGDLSACTRQESTYTVTGASNVTYSWDVTDSNATIQGSGSSIKVLWGTAGRQTITVLVEDTKIGCSEILEMRVAVQSFVNASDVNTIVAKKHDGKSYVLIYPNPKDTHYRYQWFKNGSPISGATMQDYQVYISFNADDNGNLICGAFSPVYTIGTERTALTIAPNPSNPGQQLVLNADIEGEAVLTVFSLDGKMIHQQTVIGDNPTVQLNLSKGMYFVRLSNGEQNEVTKIVVQ